MMTGQIDRARFLPGSASVREFAAREFPREDYLWVVAATHGVSAPRAGVRGFWRRLQARFGSPREGESEADTATDPAPA